MLAAVMGTHRRRRLVICGAKEMVVYGGKEVGDVGEGARARIEQPLDSRAWWCEVE
jgi:hypothetical protein